MWVKNKSLSRFILLALEKTVDGHVRLEDFLYNPEHYAYGIDWQYPLQKSDLSQAIKRLREKGLIKKDLIDTDQIILRLTDLGKETINSKIGEQWDGKYRIIFFDIPEQKRVIRNLFRRRLKEWGFTKWQQSVWISKRNVTKKVKILIHDLKIEDWIAVIESDDAIIGNRLLDGRTSNCDKQ